MKESRHSVWLQSKDITPNIGQDRQNSAELRLFENILYTSE